MEIIHAILLGLIQGATEFLPISSSGHLELGHAIWNIEGDSNLLFTTVVHGATALSTIIVFRKDISALIKGCLNFKWNEESRYIIKIIISIIPIGIAGLLLKNKIESIFSGNLVLVGSMLLITALLLAFTFFAKAKEKEVSLPNSFLIGVVQAFAILPGISRSGSTIAAAMLLGVNREKAARFSFLMVLIPIIGINLINIIDGDIAVSSNIGVAPLLAGFISAFLSGFVACRWMIHLVKKGKLIYFAAYCAIIGIITIFVSL